MSVPRYCWWLPRPRTNKYLGGFPRGFEAKLYALLGLSDRSQVLHPFGGRAEFGIRCDLNTSIRGYDISPDHVLDAHELPNEWSERFPVVVVDPPYSNDEARDLYGTPKLRPKTYMAEAVRVCQPGGFVVHYHKYLAPRPELCLWHAVITVVTRVHHTARIVSVFRKGSCAGLVAAS